MFEVITIGEEILKGNIANTNLQEIAKTLFTSGYQLDYEQAVGDSEGAIIEGLNIALLRSDVIITTGGLGPTLDDKTKRVLSTFFKKKLFTSDQIKKNLETRYGKDFPSIEEQSLIPENVELIPNSLGTAPGFVFKQDHKVVYVLPGVPLEMRAMLHEFVIKHIKSHHPLKQKKYFKKYYLIGLSENEIDPCLKVLQKSMPSIQIGIYPSYGPIQVEFLLHYQNEEELFLAKKKIESEIKEKFSSFIYSDDHPSIALAIQKILINQKQTLAAAESCTGGMIAAKITQNSGSSEFFLGSLVVYSNLLKERVLGVDKDILKKFGAVSSETVHQMLKNTQKITAADYVIAVSGIAGPLGGSSDKPVGLVYCGLMGPNGKTFVWKILAKGRGKRESVIEYTTQYILGVLYRYITFAINPY